MIPVAEIDSGILVAAVATILGGGFLGSIALLRKSGPEADQIVAKTLIEVNEHLRKELERRDKEWSEEVERRDREIERLREEIKSLRERLSDVQNDLLRVEDELTRVSEVSSAATRPSKRP